MKLGKFAIGIVLLLRAPGVRADAAVPNSAAHLITTPVETKLLPRKPVCISRLKIADFIRSRIMDGPSRATTSHIAAQRA